MKKQKRLRIIIILGIISTLVLSYSSFTKPGFIRQYSLLHSPVDKLSSTNNILAEVAEERTKLDITYDGSYYEIDYPMGDVKANIGVCTDLIIRSYRELGIDLQKLVHEDMKTSFLSYPKLWRLTKPDTNIDHRRVPNLMTYFNRHGYSLPITNNPNDYKTGNLVCWDLGNGMTHIGIVSTKMNQRQIPLIVHNIGSGPEITDILFKYKIVGHYKYP